MKNIEDLFTNVVFPTIHLNGSGGQSLLDAVRAIHHQLIETRALMNQHAPHARDYYVQGPDAFEKARDQHLQNILMIDRLTTHYEQMWLSITDQMEARKR